MIYEDIKNSVVRTVKSIYPDIYVFSEQISKTKDNPPIKDWVFIGLQPASCTTAGPYHTDHAVLLDITAHLDGEKNAAYWEMAGKLDSAIRPIVRFDDRAITVENVDIRISDGMLHYVFTLRFRDSQSVPAQPPLMESLEIDEK